MITVLVLVGQVLELRAPPPKPDMRSAGCSI